MRIYRREDGFIDFAGRAADVLLIVCDVNTAPLAADIEKILKNNSRIVTMIYGKKEVIKGILDKHPILSEDLFNIEVNKLKEKLNSININDILRIMGFNV